MPIFTKEYEKAVKQEVENWASLHPIDVWWRRKFDIPFGSKEHLDTNFLSQFHSFIEEDFLEKLRKAEPEVDEYGNQSVKSIYNVEEEEQVEKIADKLMDKLDLL